MYYNDDLEERTCNSGSPAINEDIEQDVKSSFLVFFSLGKLALFSIAIAFVHITFAVQYKQSRHY